MASLLDSWSVGDASVAVAAAVVAVVVAADGVRIVVAVASRTGHSWERRKVRK